MSDEGNHSKLTELIDIKFLQEFQDVFALSMNVASITVDENGPVTNPSNFTEFCIKYTRGSKLGLSRCNECDISWGKVASTKGEPVIYKCHTGLTDFAVPIVIDGKHIGSILGGQVLTEPPNLEHFREIARDLGINEDDYIAAVKKINIVPIENIKAAAHLLFLVANAISQIAHKNSELSQKSLKEGLYIKMIDTIRSTLDINETKQKIVDIIGKTLSADRCFIMEYDKTSDKFSIISSEYLSSKDITSYIGADVNSEVPTFMEMLKKGENISISDKKILSDEDKSRFKNEYAAIKNHNVHSAFAFPLYYLGEFLGAFAVHYVKTNHSVNDNDIQLLNIFANQISIAIYQARLYNELKQTTSNQNAILNNVPFMAWLKDKNSRFLSVNNSFASLCNLPIEDIIGKTDFDLFSHANAESYVREDLLVIESKEAIQSVDLIPDIDGAERWHETYKSPVFDSKGEVVGTVGMSRDITEKKEADLAILKQQQEIVELYNNLKETAKRESLMRVITEKIRSSLDLDETLFYICEETAKLFNVQRSAIAIFPNPDNFEDSVVLKEYRANEELLSIGSMPDFKKTGSYWGAHLSHGEQVFAIDDITAPSIPDDVKNIYSSMKIKSIIGVSIRKGDDNWGTLVLSEYEKCRHWSDEEKTLLETIANQVYIAINQAELFEKEKKTAQREKFISNIVSNAIRTFDIDQIKLIVSDVCGMTGADRCYFVEVDLEHMKGRKIGYEGEYLTSTEYKSILGYEFSTEDVQAFVSAFLASKDLVVFDYEKIRKDNNEIHQGIIRYANLFNLKSGVGIPLFYRDELVAVLAVEYIKERVIPSEDDLNYLRILGKQTSMAFSQIRLYQETKKTAEREKFSRNIIEILRNTLDRETIKSLFVTTIGKFFKADRVFISDYDTRNNQYLPVVKRSEYLSNPKEKSFIGFDWMAPEISEYTQLLLDKRELLIVSWENYISNNVKKPEFIDLFESSDVKSSYNFPVMYQGTLMGFFCIEYTHEIHEISKEDIMSIRNICTQAGIALYHSDLYIKAQESIKSKTEIVSNISDEFGIPLNYIVEHSEVASSSESPESERIETLRNINKSSRFLLGLTEDIITLSKLESEEFRTNYEKLDSYQLIMEVVNSIKFAAGDKNIKISTELVNADINIDKKIMIQIIYLILTNIIKVATQACSIQVKSELEDGKLLLSIENQDACFTEDEQMDAFVKFKQVDAIYPKRPQGFGIGLSIVRKMVSMLNGTINVESFDSNNFRFFVVLPKATKSP